MLFTKAVVIVCLALFLIAEAQPRDPDHDLSHGSGRVLRKPNENPFSFLGAVGPPLMGGRGGWAGVVPRILFFDDSCLPMDCSGDGKWGFAMLVASDAECPTDISRDNHKAFEDVVVRPKQFCETEVRK